MPHQYVESLCVILWNFLNTINLCFPDILLQGYTVANDPFPPYQLFQVLTLSLLDLGCDSISGGPQAASVSTS